MLCIVKLFASSWRRRSIDKLTSRQAPMFAVCLAAVLSGCGGQHQVRPSSTTTPIAAAKPMLLLSTTHGPSGKRVLVKATNCPRPSTGDELTWHDSRQRSNTRARPPFRSIAPLRRTGSTVTAVFVVRPSDHLGVGVLDMFCDGPTNAAALFRVTK
jgi:hypothetical protein